METIKKRVEESSIATATAIAFIMQLQKTAKKAVEEAVLSQNSQEGQEDDNISNSSDEESSDKEPEGPTQWLEEL